MPRVNNTPIHRDPPVPIKPPPPPPPKQPPPPPPKR